MISIKNLNKSYGEKEVFHNLSLEIKDGEFIGITGQSGCGKTTLLNILGCLDISYSGDYSLTAFNKSFHISENKKHFAGSKVRSDLFSFVFQDLNLIDYYSAYDNVVLPLKYKRLPIDNSLIDSIFKELKIDDLKNKKVRLLSGGEKQRVAIARSLVMPAPYILADEPTGSLDMVNTENVIKLLKETGKKFNKTLIVVTHNLDITSNFDRVIKLNGKN